MFVNLFRDGAVFEETAQGDASVPVKVDDRATKTLQSLLQLESFELAQKHFPYVYSAYGGYNFPRADLRHFHRVASSGDVLELAMVMDGYTGLRQCVGGNAWGLKSDALLPY